MSGLREYLQVKREKMLAWRKKISADGSQPSTISAQATASVPARRKCNSACWAVPSPMST